MVRNQQPLNPELEIISSYQKIKITLMSVVLSLLLHLNILEFLNFKIDKTDSVIAAQS